MYAAEAADLPIVADGDVARARLLLGVDRNLLASIVLGLLLQKEGRM
jgi:hypothetical protein